nr:hypothetical protein [Nitrosomonas nitrosa]
MNRQTICLVAIATIFAVGAMSPLLTLAAEDGNIPEEVQPNADDKGKAEDSSTEEAGEKTNGYFFTNLGIGGAIGWTHNLGRSRVEQVSAPNGIVRIDEDRNNLARPWVEFHTWLWESKKDLLGGLCTKERQCGIGPFVAVAPGGNFVDAVGAGIMVGRKLDSMSNVSFNFSVGGALELDSKVLGDGVVANQPLPPGETSVRTRTTSVGSLLFMFSVGYDVLGGSTSSSALTSPKRGKEDLKTPKPEPGNSPTDTPVPTKEWNPEIVRNFIGPLKPRFY